MTASALPAHPHPSRGRRSSRPSGDDRELAILATAERLLEQRPLGEISVDDLAKGAGISRPTFYFYFPSKDAVLLTLFDRMMSEADATFDELAEKLSSADPLRVCRDGINAFFLTFGRHRAAALAAEPPAIVDDKVVDTLAQIWFTTIYGAVTR